VLVLVLTGVCLRGVGRSLPSLEWRWLSWVEPTPHPAAC
jgi:hypothetical protein